MGRPKKYNAKKLEKAVEGYFASISRIVPVTEQVPTDERDSHGHVIFRTVPVMNQLGKQIKLLEYVVPPTVGGLCAHLGIHRSSWANFANDEELAPVVEAARGRLQAYLEQQLLERKDVKGIVFDLENNYGYRERRSVEVTGGVESYLGKLDEAEEEQAF